jgi:hypothetical protein
MDLRCGHLDEWQFFAERFGSAIDALTRAHDTCFAILTLPCPDGQEQNVIYILAAACLKEFEEICLLAGNGYGGGATKLLRSFYERVVTLSYLALKPTKVQQFIDYTNIHWHKLLCEAEKIHSTVKLTPEKIQKIKDDYENHKDHFMEDLCKPCKKRRPQMAWTKKPIPDQASEVNQTLRALCFNAYLRPTFYLHTTFLGITWQAQKTDAGKLRFLGTEIERESARESLELAHILLVHVAEVVNDFFRLGQNERVKKIAREWKDSWEHVAKSSNGTPS